MQYVQLLAGVNKRTKNGTALPITCLLCILALCSGHSAMMEPENISPSTCRMGGEPQSGVESCAGPCDLRAVQGGWANHGSADNPAAIYSRGQKVTVKYQRNNHGPGGFIKMSIVPVDEIMNLTKHKENAFHYTCWGGNPVVAEPNELGTRQHGYSMVGNDGEQHSFQKGYYTIEITIPPVVPDGDYILRMVWYGGIGNSVLGNAPQMPTKHGFFGDYHSCSFVKVEGGVALEGRYRPKFVNDMEQFSKEGCMSANDHEGVCVYEPCKVDGEFQNPLEFKDGKSPAQLTPGNFNGMTSAGNEPSTTSNPSTAMSFTQSPSASPSFAMSMVPSPSALPGSSESWYVQVTPLVIATTLSPAVSQMESIQPAQSPMGDDHSTKTGIMVLSCYCISYGKRCSHWLAKNTEGQCMHETGYSRQPEKCKNACCAFCDKDSSYGLCKSTRVQRVCRNYW